MFRFGFDIGGTNIAYGIDDESYSFVYKASVRFPHSPAAEVAELLNELVISGCKDAKVALDEIELVGICIPGSIDKHQEVVINAYNLDFHNVPFRKMAADAIGKPVQLMNDADAAALAEYGIGALRNKPNSMLITIGTGIGGGIILNGELFHGGNGNGIELGHVQMDIHGESCTCGRRGCIETLCSASYLNKRALQLYDDGVEALSRYCRDEVDGRILIGEAKKGDKECLAVWDQYVNNLAEALASYINFIDPECIAVGGGVSRAGEFLLKPLRKLAAEKCFFSDNPPEIVCAALGNDAGLLGSVM